MGGMNKAVLGLSLLMAVFVAGTIGVAVIQFLEAAQTKRGDNATSESPADLWLPQPVPEDFLMVMNKSSIRPELHKLVDAAPAPSTTPEAPVPSPTAAPVPILTDVSAPARIRIGDWNAPADSSPDSPALHSVLAASQWTVSTLRTDEVAAPADTLTSALVESDRSQTSDTGSYMSRPYSPEPESPAPMTEPASEQPPEHTPLPEDFTAPSKIRVGQWKLTTPLVRLVRNASVTETPATVMETTSSVTGTATSVTETASSEKEITASVAETVASEKDTAAPVTESAVSLTETAASVSETAASVSETAASASETIVSLAETTVSVTETAAASATMTEIVLTTE